MWPSSGTPQAGPGHSLPANTGLVQKPFTERALLEAVRIAIATPCEAPESGVSDP
jgi:hypothetical protein